VGCLKKEGSMGQKRDLLDFQAIPGAKPHAGSLMLVRVLLLLLILPSLATTLAAAATIRGNVYDYSFDEINDVIVSIDSSPRQQYIVKNGTYFFEVPPGIYNLTAKYYENNRLVYESDEMIHVEKEGSFIYDIILFPSTEEEEMLYYGMDENISDLRSLEGENTPALGQKDLQRIKYTMFTAAGIIILLICAAALLLFMLKRQRRSASAVGAEKGVPDGKDGEKVAQKNAQKDALEGGQAVRSHTQTKEAAADEVHDVHDADDKGDDYGTMVLRLITQHKRITQKDIRKEVPLSEAKISLIIAELEAKGIIRKVKKGRGNIIFLNK
jgi:uncharacterized membrane protein